MPAAAKARQTATTAVCPGAALRWLRVRFKVAAIDRLAAVFRHRDIVATT
jgi:hypothetical protein